MKGRKGFAKGESSNPDGFLPIGDDLKNARKLTRVEFERVANKYLHMNWHEIKDLVGPESSKNLPMLDFMVLSVMNHAVKEGDPKRLDFLLDRTIGMAVRRHQVIYEDEPVVKEIPVEMSTEEKLEMLEMYKSKLIDVTPKEEK